MKVLKRINKLRLGKTYLIHNLNLQVKALALVVKAKGKHSLLFEKSQPIPSQIDYFKNGFFKLVCYKICEEPFTIKDDGFIILVILFDLLNVSNFWNKSFSVFHIKPPYLIINHC
jgi:hypothetical protein